MENTEMNNASSQIDAGKKRRLFNLDGDKLEAEDGLSPPKKRYRPVETSSVSNSGKNTDKAKADSNKKANIDESGEGEVSSKYKLWKRNTPILYDFILHNGLSWASLTCSFGKRASKSESTTKHSIRQTLYFSSRTSAKFAPQQFAWTEFPPSEVLIANVDLPSNNTVRRTALGRFAETNRSSRVTVRKTIIHPGEVNRVRAFKEPYSHLIVSKTESPCVFLWDTKKQEDKTEIASKSSSSVDSWVKSTKDEEFGVVNENDILNVLKNKPQRDASYPASVPDVTLTGHTDKAEYALHCCSNSLKVVSGGADAKVLVWDVNDYESSGPVMKPTAELIGHEANVEDCEFHPENSNVCCSVGDDMLMMVWDSRTGSTPVIKAENVHTDDINCCAYNQIVPHYVLTGSSDTTIKLHDLRKLPKVADFKTNQFKVVKTIEHHKSSVLNLKWSPTDALHFASTSEDSVLILWKLSEINQAQEPNIVFQHRGHKSAIADFDWCAHEEGWAFATVTDSSDEGGGSMQIWRISDFIAKADNAEFKEGLNSLLSQAPTQ